MRLLYGAGQVASPESGALSIRGIVIPKGRERVTTCHVKFWGLPRVSRETETVTTFPTMVKERSVADALGGLPSKTVETQCPTLGSKVKTRIGRSIDVTPDVINQPKATKLVGDSGIPPETVALNDRLVPDRITAAETTSKKGGLFPTSAAGSLKTFERTAG